MRIGVAYDYAADRDGSADTVGVKEAVDAVVESLVRLGHAAFPVAVALPLDRFLNRLGGVDLIFNLAEGFGGRAEDEPRLAALMELSGRPVTGAPFDALALCRRKDRVNALLESRGLAIPPWILAAPDQAVEWDRFPAIVKPAGEDGSVGIDEASVVENPLELAAALGRMPGHALVQAFVGGRELQVGIVGDEVMPVAEIVFAGRQRVIGYAAKWSPGSEADRDTRPVCPARITTTLHESATELAFAAWSALGGRGYGRVDLRTDDGGRLHLLEVNPNPDLAPSAGLARMARVRGWSFGDLVGRIVREALP
jgi:D-alanine-D-alanine ligase